MLGKIKNYSPKNKGIQIETDKYVGDKAQWFTIPEDMLTILETTKKEQEVDFTYEIQNENKILNKFSLIKPKDAKDDFKPAKEVTNENKDKYWQDKLEFDIRKQEIITKEALLNTAVEIMKKSEQKYIDNNVLVEDTINIAKRLYKELSRGW